MGKGEGGEDSLLAQSELSRVRFCLAQDVTFSEQHQRGEIWVVIQNNVSNKHFSTTPLVRDFVEQFRTAKTLAEVMKKFPGCDQLPPEDWLDLLTKLMSADVLNSPDINHDEYKLQTHLDQKSQASKSKWSRPWMVKIPLGNPNALLAKVSSGARYIWTFPVFILWVLLVALGAVQTVEHFSSLQDFWATRFLDPNNILLALFIYPVLKFIHELGHGLAAKHWGADVVETGVLLILFVPLPYVDVSQSSFFQKKHQRMIVAAAGMMFELSVSVCALMVWLATDSILLKDICMNIILIGAVSSIFFNANPLLKFDGYYLLSDFLEIPNLGTRSVQMSKYVLYHYVFKLPVKVVAHSLAEARWLLCYGVLSQCYRLTISFYIALYLGSQYFAVGVVLACWLVLTQILKPWVLGLSALWNESKKHAASKRVSGIVGGVGALVLIVVFVIPFNFNRTFSGILVLDGSSQIQAHASGFIDEMLVTHNSTVKKGQALFHLRNSTLSSELEYIQGKINESETLDHQYRSNDPAQAAYHSDQANAYKQEWDNLNQEFLSMIVRSPVDGLFQGLSQANSEGRYIAKGDRLGDVVSRSNARILLMLTEEEMKKSGQFKSAQVILDSMLGTVLGVSSVQAVPGAVMTLPSPYLGSLYGGSVPVDSSKSSGVELLKPMFKVEVGIDSVLYKPIIGTRAHLKLTGEGKSLGLLAYHKVIKTLRDRGIL